MGLTGSFQEICDNDAFRNYVFGDTYTKMRAEGLHGFEIVQ